MTSLQDKKKKWENRVWRYATSRSLITQSCETIRLACEEDDFEVVLHKDLLCFYSSYYHAALKGQFKEAEKDRLTIKCSEASLEILLGWLYTGKVGVASESALIHVYLLADSVDMPGLRRDTITAIQKSMSILGYRDVAEVYASTAESSPLRRYLLDNYARHWGPNDDLSDDSEVTPEKEHISLVPLHFFYDVMSTMAEHRADPELHAQCVCCHDFCAYHDHSSDEERKATCGTVTNTDTDSEATGDEDGDEPM